MTLSRVARRCSASSIRLGIGNGDADLVADGGQQFFVLWRELAGVAALNVQQPQDLPAGQERQAEQRAKALAQAGGAAAGGMGGDVGGHDQAAATAAARPHRHSSRTDDRFVGDKGIGQALVGVQDQFAGLLVDEKDLASIHADHLQRGLQGAARISSRSWVQFTWAAMAVRAASSALRARSGNGFPPLTVTTSPCIEYSMVVQKAKCKMRPGRFQRSARSQNCRSRLHEYISPAVRTAK